MHSLSYENRSPWPTGPDGGGPSLALIDPSLGGSLPVSWRASHVLGGTPGFANTPAPVSGVYVNEVLAVNDSTIADELGEYDDWMELYNVGDEAVDVGGLYITDTLSQLTRWQIPIGHPDSTTIQAKGFLVLWADGEPDEGVLHLDLNALVSSGTRLRAL